MYKLTTLLAVVACSSFAPVHYTPKEQNVCEALQQIVAVLKKDKYDALKGKEKVKEGYASTIDIAQWEQETIDEEYGVVNFSALYKAKSKADAKSNYDNLVKSVSKCMKLKPVYSKGDNAETAAFEVSTESVTINIDMTVTYSGSESWIDLTVMK
jgi:Ran GTPase-activating protein (RanGAP) involved in mRNA processing and transport